MRTNFIYIWCLFANDGFYMEPDVSLIKLALTKQELKEYIKKHPKKHLTYFIEKRRLKVF